MNIYIVRKVCICICLYALFSVYAVYSQPGPPARILIPIKKDNILKGDFLNNYLVDAFVFKDSFQKEEELKSKYVTYYNNKNYYPFEIYNDSVATLYPSIPNERDIPKGYTIRISFLEKSTLQEMIIYFRLPRNFGYEMFLELENLNFQGGSFFFDGCESKRKYRIKSSNKRNYGVGKIKITDEKYPLTESVDMSDMSTHRITEEQLNLLIQTNSCK